MKKEDKETTFVVRFSLEQSIIQYGQIEIQASTAQEAIDKVNKMEEDGELDDFYGSPDYLTGDFSIDNVEKL
jgi:hypothetical protein